MHLRARALPLLILLVMICRASLGADEGRWPQWRGPNRDNISSDTGLLKAWPNGGPSVLWSVAGIGAGIPAVAVADGRVIVVGDIDGQEYVTALDENNGQRLWATPIGPAADTGGVMRLMRWLSQRTPTIDQNRLYVITARGRLACLSTADGTELWHKDYSRDFGSGDWRWGFCDYPLVDGDVLICRPSSAAAGVVALNKQSGEVVWQQPSERDTSVYCAAVVVPAGRRSPVVLQRTPRC